MPQIISPGVIPQWIARMQAPSKELPEYTGVGEPPEYSLDLDQLQSIISTDNPQLMGFYREGITSRQQERTKLQERLRDTTLSDIQKLQIDKQIQSIDDVIGEPGKEFSDSDVANMIIRGEPDLQRKLKSYVPASYGEPGSLPAVLGKSMGMMFKDLPSKVTPFLTSIARNMTLPKTPYQRRMYEVGRNMELQRADKVRGLLETRNRDDNQEQYDAWEKELAGVDEYLASHPEWKDEKRYPPKESFTPFELKFEDAMLKAEDAARQDLEKVSLMDTETLAYYKWVQQQNMRNFMDGRGFQAKTFMHHLGQGLASYAPAAAAGFVTGVVTKSPTAGLTVGRTVMGVMEGSDQYNQAMQYAQENGLDIEEARQLALGTGVTYGVGSAWMEGWVPGMWMKRLGLTVDKPIKSMLRKSLFGRINKNAVGKYAAAKVISGKALDKIPFFLQSAGAEGFQELSQYLYQVGIQADYMDEGGDNYLDRYMNVYDVSEAATSAYAGTVTGGVLGGISGAIGQPGAEAERAVSAAEAEKKKIAGKVEPIAFELPTGEVEYGDNPIQDYLIRLSDVKKTQLSPESVEEGASSLDISIYEKKGAKSSVDKLFGLIERVGTSAVKEISGLSDDDKSGLLELVRGKVNQETPEVNLTTDEDALKFLNAFAQGGKRVETSKRVDLGAPQVVVETKFDPKGMPVSAQKDIADLGFPTTIFESPPKIPTIAPAIPEAPTISEKPPIVEKMPEPKEMPMPKEPTLEQISKMAAAKKPKGVTSELVKYAKDISTADPTIKSVKLVGSVAREGKGKDIDIFYDFGKRNIPDEIQEDSNELEIFVQEQILNESKSDIDIVKYDNIIKMTDQKGEKLYFHYNLEFGLKYMTNQKVIDSIESGKSIDLIKVKAPPEKPAVKKVDVEIPLRKGQKEKLKKGYKWFTIGVGEIVKGKFVEERTVRTQGKEIKLKGSPKDLNWFVNKGTDGLWVVTNVETGRTVATPAFGDTMKAAIEFAESEISKPENIERMKELALPKKPAVSPVVEAPPVVKALTDVKAYMQNRRKMDDDPSNIVYNATQSKLTLKHGNNDEIQKEISRLDTLIPNIEKDPTKYIPRKGFWQRGDSVEKRVSELKDIKNQLVDKLKAPEVAKVTPEDVHKAAEAVGMAWDDDAAFMALSKRVTGKDRIDDMTSGEMASLIAEISKEAPPVVKPDDVTKSGIQIYKKFITPAEKIYQSFKYIILNTGRKSFGWTAAWYGPIDYTYTGITHKTQEMPKEFSDLARQIEEATGVESGYYNSALVNLFPKGKGIGAHADDENIFVRENNTIGKVATVSLGGSTQITISGATDDVITVNAGDVYIMPGQEFQLKHKHAVGPSNRERISLTFRHIPKVRLKAAPTAVDVPLGPVKQVKAEKPKGTATKGIKDIKFKVKDEDKIYAAQDNWPTISEEPELYDKILKRLVKRLPFVKPGLLTDGLKLSFEREKDFPFEAARVFGRSIGMSVQWLKEAAPIDTPPHEFFHSYFRLLQKTPIVKLAINKFKKIPEVIELLENNKLYPHIQTIDHAVEEYLAGHIGEMYVERVRAGIPAKVKAWFKRFWLTLKKMFKPSKLTAKDIMQIIFEEFYRGIVPGMTAKEAAEAAEIIEAEGIPKYKTYNESEQYVDQPSEDGADEGNELSIDYRAASLVHYEAYFSKAFGRYIKREQHGDMVEVAKINKEVGFDGFFNDIKTWASEELLDEAGVGVDIDKEYTREEKNYLKQFFLRANSSMKVFDINTDENGIGKRMYLDAFYNRDDNSFDFEWSESEELGNNQNNRRKRPGWKTTNFVELQGLERVIHLPLNNIVEIVPNQDYDSKAAERAEEEGAPYTVEKEFVFPANIRIDGGTIMQWNIEFGNDFETGKSKNLLFIAGAKGGGGGEIFIGDVHEEHRNMTQQQFLDYLNSEVAKGFMTNTQASSSIVGAVRYTEPNKQIYSQIVGRHEFMKNVKGSNYLLRKRKGKPISIKDHFNRLRLDFSEGTTPYGLGDTRIMLFEPDEVTLKIDGKDVPLKVFAGTYAFDGWLMSSGDFFKNLANTIGRKPSIQGNNLYEAKTVIRHLSNDLVDYLGLKMMQMTPYEGMEFFRDGEKFAEVKVRRGTTVFVDNNNVEFHHLGSSEESKMIAGKYDRDKEHGGLSDEDGFYKLHTLDEKHIKVLFVPSEFSKNKSAYPVAEGELTLDPALVDNPDYIKFIDALTTHYKNVGRDYLSTLFQMHSDPKLLRKEIYRELNTGEMPTEIQEYLDEFGESGEGIHLPYLISIILPILNNRFINNGLYKVRQRGEDGTGGLSTILVLKPIADLTVGKNEFGVSANNQTVFNRLQKLILEDAETRIMGLVAGDDVESVEGAVDAWYNLPRDERIDMMNNFLKAKPMYAKLSRQPVTGPAVTIMRRISKIVDGDHADVAFLTPEDVAIIQGDFDGDKIGMEMFDNSQTENAFVEWQKTDAYNNRKKTAYTGIFKLVKKKTIMTDYSDFLKSMEDLSVAANSQGLVTNSKIIGNILAYKEVKIRLKDPKGKLGEDVYFEAKTPSETVTMDYAPLDKESLMENDFELLKLLEDQGDEVVAFAGGLYREKITSDNIGDVDAKSNLYLKTTHEHEMTNLLQIAVDDVSLGLLSKIGYDSRFMLDRMFKRVGDGGPIGQFAPKGVNHALAQLRQIFNYSPVRRGSVSGVQATIQQNIGMSRNINNFINAKNLVKTTMVKNEINSRSKKGNPKFLWWYEGFEVTSVTMNDRIVPVEELLSLLAKEIMTRVDESTDSQFNSEWGGAPGVYSYDVYKTAHVNAMKEMESRWSDIASTNNVTEQEMAKGVALMQKISKDFFKIYSDINKSTPGKVVRLRPEYNEPLRNLVDDYIDDWNKLSDNSQMYATLYFLAGTPTRDKSGKPVKRVNVMKMLPISLMHKPMVKSFAKVWWNMMTKSINSKFKQPKDTRGEMYKGLKFGESVELSKKIADRFCG